MSRGERHDGAGRDGWRGVPLTRRRCDVDAVWAEYFDRLTQAAASGLFEIIGHADLPKKFRHLPKRDITPLGDDSVIALRPLGAEAGIEIAEAQIDQRIDREHQNGDHKGFRLHYREVQSLY